MQGLIRKGIGGFYYVETDCGIYASKARGLFRKKGQTPLVGDRVEIEVTHEGDKEAYITAICPRKNSLIRPPVANLERLFIVAALHNPPPSTLMIDKLIAICEKKGIEPVVVLNKADLGRSRRWSRPITGRDLRWWSLRRSRAGALNGSSSSSVAGCVLLPDTPASENPACSTCSPRRPWPRWAIFPSGSSGESIPQGMWKSSPARGATCRYARLWRHFHRAV